MNQGLLLLSCSVCRTLNGNESKMMNNVLLTMEALRMDMVWYGIFLDIGKGPMSFQISFHDILLFFGKPLQPV